MSDQSKIRRGEPKPTLGSKFPPPSGDCITDRKRQQPKPTGEWTLVPRALHFNIMCGDTVIYEGVTSEKQGNNLVARHTAERANSFESGRIKQGLAMGTEIQQLREQLADRHKLCVDFEMKWKAECEKSRVLGNMTDGFRTQLEAALAAIERELTHHTEGTERALSLRAALAKV